MIEQPTLSTTAFDHEINIAPSELTLYAPDRDLAVANLSRRVEEARAESADPTHLESLELLLEEARTNPYSTVLVAEAANTERWRIAGIDPESVDITTLLEQQRKWSEASKAEQERARVEQLAQSKRQLAESALQAIMINQYQPSLSKGLDINEAFPYFFR